MEKADMYVSLSPAEAAEKVKTAVTESFSGEILDEYKRAVSDGKEIILIVFEKYYMRSNNRATLTFLADNLEGKTKVHLAAGGGSEGMIFRFDWGASSSFGELAEKALKEFVCE